MNLRGIVVCVDCSDLLRLSLDRWHVGLDRLIVVTSTWDEKTHALCKELGVEAYKTDIFYANGASFNKGAAMSEAVIATGLRDDAEWLMTFDADIVPPVDWRDQLERANLRMGCIYGARRWMVPENGTVLVPNGKPMPQSWVIGFFMVFHDEDPCTPNPDEPLFDLYWPHAGNYDTIFCRRWSRSRQIILPGLKTLHLGEERKNWMGRYERVKLKAVLQQRRGHEDWNRERMPNPPALVVRGKTYASRS